MRKQPMVAITILLAAFVAITSCSRSTRAPKREGLNENTAEAPRGTVGILSVDQILLAMTGVTKVAPTQSLPGGGGTLAEIYSNIAPFMSYTGNIGTINASMLLSLTGFAGSVCSVWLANEASLEGSKPNSSLANMGVPFSKGATAVTPALAAQIVAQYSALFWGRQPTEEETAILTEAILETQAFITNPGAAGMRDLLLVPCTAFLASPAFLAG